LEKNEDKISWIQLSKNPHPRAIELLEKHIQSRAQTGFLDEVEWNWVSANPSALPLLEKYPHEIKWGFASSNLGILPLLEKNPDKIHWETLCMMICPALLPFLEKYLYKLCHHCWYFLSSLPDAVPLLEKYPLLIDWGQLSRNPGALHLLSQRPEKIDMHHLSANPNATHWLFRLDYTQMHENLLPFREELNAFIFEPGRLLRMSTQYGLDMRTYLKMY
jgi:hypothetical protein